MDQKYDNNYIIENISLDDVNKYGKEKFNSNNHWLNNTPPEDYEISQTDFNTSVWIDKFKSTYIVYNIAGKDLYWMKEASKLGQYTGNFSNIYQEDLEDYLAKLSDPFKIFSLNSNYFIRTENVSLKDGCYGVGPYSNFEMIIKSIITAIKGHSPLQANTTNIKLFFLPWIKIEKGKEVRIFVHNNKITCISQQNLYNKNEYLSNFSNDEINKILHRWIEIIVNYFEETIKKKVTHVQSYSIDLALIENDEPYFIEINPFGKEYAAGSSLYHWLLDEEKLYDKNSENKIYFRYVGSD